MEAEVDATDSNRPLKKQRLFIARQVSHPTLEASSNNSRLASTVVRRRHDVMKPIHVASARVRVLSVPMASERPQSTSILLRSTR